ncbi:MAG: PAS domain-containing protein [Planctomycetota bacterium]|jgi:photoactive yellow protein
MTENSSSDDAPFLDPTSPVAIRRIQQVASMSRGELDELPFGAIEVDGEGTILQYNAAEARLAGLDPKDVIGKNFFAEVAPCTNVQEFAGRFRAELTPDRLSIAFPYEFKFASKRMSVLVLMHIDPESGRRWIFVQGE